MDIFQLIVQCSLHDRFTDQQTITHEPLDKCVRILKIRKLPGRAVEPERATAGIRQVHSPIHKITRGEVRSLARTTTPTSPACRVLPQNGLVWVAVPDTRAQSH